ncbi:MAG: DUF4159 domain-containing protein, partial [Chloroflexi bacterium]|nr:DUF4159 domain-containing protein [Chloroflexota bacterium]
FPGMMVDADIWSDAHRYHRDAGRLHLLAFHSTGIVGGLEVNQNDPPDLSVTIRPGLAADPDGNIVIVAQPQRYKLQTRERGIIYLIIQFREIPGPPLQPPDGGQPTRITEGYRIQERDKLPNEPYVELARIDFDPADPVIRDPKVPSKPVKNEIDFRHRQGAGMAAPAPAPIPSTPPSPPPPQPERVAPIVQPGPTAARETVTVGYLTLGGTDGLHRAGIENLVREVSWRSGINVEMRAVTSLKKDVKGCQLLYVVGNSRFEIPGDLHAALGDLLKSGGVIFGEGCSEGQPKGAKEFGLAFNQLATQLKCKLEAVQRDHPLLTCAHIFSQVPQGVEPGMLLEGGRMVYSAGDYGCAWRGGRPDSPLPRETIRTAVEMGANILAFAKGTK